MIMKNVLATSLLILIASHALGAESAVQTKSKPLPKGWYVGGGLSYNDLDLDSVVKDANNEAALGLQGFTGLPISNSIDGFETFAEIGLFRTNNFDFGQGKKDKAVGIWGSLVLQKELNEVAPHLYGLARIGLELGDDDGIFMGVGIGYRLTPKVEVRTEFVNKDLISSYQVNALLRF
jgi:opacity protein-like surface antigen